MNSIEFSQRLLKSEPGSPEIAALARDMVEEARYPAYHALQRYLSRYFWGSGSDIKIVVKDGQVILLGTVASKSDSDVAYIQANAVPSVFKVFNMLRVAEPVKKKAQAAGPEASARQSE